MNYFYCPISCPGLKGVHPNGEPATFRPPLARAPSGPGGRIQPFTARCRAPRGPLSSQERKCVRKHILYHGGYSQYPIPSRGIHQAPVSATASGLAPTRRPKPAGASSRSRQRLGGSGRPRHPGVQKPKANAKLKKAQKSSKKLKKGELYLIVTTARTTPA